MPTTTGATTVAYSDRATTCAIGSPFLARVRAATLDYAAIVAAESTGVTNHPTRWAYAIRQFDDINGYLSINLGWLVSADGTDNTATDATIAARVAAVWTSAAALATGQPVT